uniref:Uncharacterized protein n=1 Tax=Glossina austeni TaxID=7395 RepID=A0A1A9VH46_GLOAU
MNILIRVLSMQLLPSRWYWTAIGVTILLNQGSLIPVKHRNAVVRGAIFLIFLVSNMRNKQKPIFVFFSLGACFRSSIRGFAFFLVSSFGQNLLLISLLTKLMLEMAIG